MSDNGPTSVPPLPRLPADGPAPGRGPSSTPSQTPSQAPSQPPSQAPSQPPSQGSSPAPSRGQDAGPSRDRSAGPGREATWSAASRGPDGTVSLVRPYAWTQGRTRSTVQLELETLVSTAGEPAAQRAVGMERRSIAELCRHPHSVAEVAAKLSVPLGVARVLVSDMAEIGLLTVHHTVAGEDTAAHAVLMERVLSGLREL